MSGVVVVVGSLNIDSVMRVTRHPRPGETVLARELRTFPGGKGANQALAAARAGAQVHLIGRIGSDLSGRRYVDALPGLGVEVTGVQITENERTGAAYVIVDDTGENTIFVASGANKLVTPRDVDDSASLIRSADVLILQLEVPMAAVSRAAEVAAEANVRVVFNASPAADIPAELLAYADPVIVNEHELASVSNDARSVCLTLGEQGGRWGPHTAKPPVVNVVDTTGAGDSFAGALAAALAAGQEEASALQLAVAAGAKATTWNGAQGWQLDD